MPRHPHYLKPVKGGNMPPSIVCVATAGNMDGDGWWGWRVWYSDPIEFDSGEQRHGKGKASFWAALHLHCRTVKGSWVMFVNAAHELTRLGFWELLEDGTWRIAGHDEKGNGKDKAGQEKAGGGVCIIENPPTIIQASGPHRLSGCQIVDALNFGIKGWPSLVAGTATKCHAEIESQVKATALLGFVCELTQCVLDNRLGSLKTTAASQAMHAYKHRFLRSAVNVHTNWPAIGLERDALYAGRNECFTIGKAPGMVWHLDFNAFYPSVCVGAMMPARIAGHRMDGIRDPMKLTQEGYLCIAEVTLETNVARFPVRFNRSRHATASVSGDGYAHAVLSRDGDCVYPIGRLCTALCGPELSLAYQAGCVKQVHSVSWYEPSELFTQWSCELAIVEELASKRPTKALRQFIKRLRNALFGKFGQWDWKWVAAPAIGNKLQFETWYEPDGESGDMVRHRAIGGYVQKERRTGEGNESCPAITAWVYSLARAKLWQAIDCAGQSNVHYTDADSLWVTNDGFNRLKSAGWLHGTLPGKLKIAGMHESVTFHGLKHYTVDGKQVHCGVPDAVPGSFEQGWSYELPETVQQALALKRAPEERTVRHTVKPSGVYRHGIVTVGGRVLPHTINEG